MFLSELSEFPLAPCPAGNKKLMTVRVSMWLKSRASLICLRGCVLPGRAKDLSALRYISSLFEIYRRRHIRILQYFDWLAAFHLYLLQAILSIAVQLSAALFLATCFKFCSRDLPTAFSPPPPPHFFPPPFFIKKSFFIFTSFPLFFVFFFFFLFYF